MSKRSKQHTCEPVCDEDETLYTNEFPDGVLISQTFVCRICSKPMDAPTLVPNTISLALQLALGKL